MILHIVPTATWEATKESGQYRGDTLESEGFIHCSEAHQVVSVANFRFANRQDLSLLIIDPERLNAEVKYEDGGEGELFPHIYGPMNHDAVLACVEFKPDKSGQFRLPAQVASLL